MLNRLFSRKIPAMSHRICHLRFFPLVRTIAEEISQLAVNWSFLCFLREKKSSQLSLDMVAIATIKTGFLPVENSQSKE